MKAVILAAGKGTRMAPLTYDIPKPLALYKGKTLLEHKFDILPDSITEIVLVVGYLGHHIVEKFGHTYKDKKLTYVTQEVLNGTGGAIHCAKDHLNTPFIVMMGDDLYASEDVENVLEHPFAVVVQEMQPPFQGGRIVQNNEGLLEAIIEGVHQEAGYINTGLFKLSPEFFDYPLVKLEKKEEFGLPQTLVHVSKDFPVTLIPATHWQQITTMQDVGL